MVSPLLVKTAGKTWLQTVSQALLLPAMVLPLAGLLVVAGDLLMRSGLAAASLLALAGFELIARMPLLIAVSLAYATAVEQTGLAALSGAIAVIVLNQTGAAFLDLLNRGRDQYSPFNMGLLAGIIAGLTAGCLQNYCRERRLPRWLGGFPLSRLVPVIAAAAALAEGLVAGVAWTYAQRGLASLAVSLTLAGPGGAFVYGLLNRLLQPLGLHHVLNDEIWLKWGEFTSQSGILIRGDLNRLLAGDPTGGRSVAGFYPVMIFSLPAAALSLWLAAKRPQRWKMAILMTAVGLAALVSGVSEPLEYLILFASPLLYVLLAIIYGLSQLICFQLQVHAGFTFSTGLSDYLATWSLGSNPQRVWQVGLVLAALAFGAFYLAVRVLKLPAPGREGPPEIHSRRKSNGHDLADAVEEECTETSAEFVSEPLTDVGEAEQRAEIVMADQPVPENAKNAEDAAHED